MHIHTLKYIQMSWQCNLLVLLLPLLRCACVCVFYFKEDYLDRKPSVPSRDVSVCDANVRDCVDGHARSRQDDDDGLDDRSRRLRMQTHSIK